VLKRQRPLPISGDFKELDVTTGIIPFSLFIPFSPSDDSKIRLQILPIDRILNLVSPLPRFPMIRTSDIRKLSDFRANATAHLDRLAETGGYRGSNGQR